MFRAGSTQICMLLNPNSWVKDKKSKQNNPKQTSEEVTHVIALIKRTKEWDNAQ